MSTTTPRNFDALAATWDDNPGRGAVSLAVARAIIAQVPLRPDMRALDFGAGTGLVTLTLSPHLAEVVALDTSAGMLEVLDGKLAAAGVTNVSTLLRDLAETDLDAGPFDLIFSTMAMHHVTEPATVLRRLAVALHPGATLAIVDLDAEDGTFHPDPTGIFHHGFSADQMHALLAAAGLTNLTTTLAHTVTKPTADGEDRSYPILLTVGQSPI